MELRYRRHDGPFLRWSARGLFAIGIMLFCERGEAVQASARVTQADRCGDATWSRPRELRTEQGAAAAVDAPQIVPARTGTLLIGPTLVSVEEGDSVRFLVGALGPPAAGLVLTHEGQLRPISLPSGFQHLGHPRATSDRRGGAHVVWAAETIDSLNGHRQVEALWYAHYDGEQWGVPQLVARGLPVRWSSSSSFSVMERDDELFFAAPGGRLGSGAAVYVFSGTTNGWRTSTLLLDRLPAAYATLGSSAETLVLAYVAADVHAGRSDRNSVFVQRSPDKGMTWSPPQRVHASGRAGAYDPTIVGHAGDTLYLLWAQRRPGGSSTELVALRLSADRGLTWHTIPDLDVGFAFDSFRAVAGPGGRGVIWLARADTAVLEGEFRSSWAWRRLAATSLLPPAIARVGPDSLLAVVGTFRSHGKWRIFASSVLCRRG